MRCAARERAPRLLSAPRLALTRVMRLPSGDDGAPTSGASPLSVQSTLVHVLNSPSAAGSYDRYSRAPVSTVATSAGAPCAGFVEDLALTPHLGRGGPVAPRLGPARLPPPGLFFVAPPAMTRARPTLATRPTVGNNKSHRNKPKGLARKTPQPAAA